MKTPCLALHLVAATLMAAPWHARADALHSSPGLVSTMVSYAKPLGLNVTVRPDLVSVPGGHGGAPMLGDVPYSTATNDRFDVALRSPHTQPYLGVGYGQTSAGGSSFLFDIGGSFVRASSSDTPGGPRLATGSQSALDNELAQLRDGIERVRFMPQVSLGMNLRF
jgi:hypothetical protein